MTTLMTAGDGISSVQRVQERTETDIFNFHDKKW